MVFCIKKCFSYLCLVHSTEQEFPDLNFDSPGIPESIEDILLVIIRLRELYNAEIESVVDKIVGSKDWLSPQYYVNAILRRCVKLSTNPSQWDFMLICSLISNIISEQYLVTECFTFANLGLQCLLQVYNRCYKELFHSVDEYQSLTFYCRCLNHSLISEEYDSEKPWLLYTKERISSLIDIDEANFQFTDTEQEIFDSLIAYIQTDSIIQEERDSIFESSSNNETSLEKTIYCSKVPAKTPEGTIDCSNVLDKTPEGTIDYSNVPDKTNSEEAIDCSNLSDKTSSEETIDCLNLSDKTSSEETIDCSNVPENPSSRINRICIFCGVRCFGIVLSYQNELAVRCDDL